MADTPDGRVLYICLMGLALVPLIIGTYPLGEILSLAALFFVVLYIRSDRKEQESRQRGFLVIPKDPGPGNSGLPIERPIDAQHLGKGSPGSD